MQLDIQKVREFIGNDDIESAIQTLLEALRNGPHPDLLDSIYLQKGHWSEYKRRRMAGVEDERDLNLLRDRLMQIARELDSRPQAPPMPEVKPFHFPDLPPMPPPPSQPPYVARCFFNGDPNAYFVTPTNQILMINPATNFTSQVATRMPSMDPNFAWVYLFPNGFYYSIDHGGAIWGLNAFGMPMQMGYVQYL